MRTNQIYTHLFEHLQTCGGCAGLRNQAQCHFAVVCAHVERLAKKGKVKSSLDFNYPYSIKTMGSEAIK